MFWWLFLILNALFSPVFGAHERENWRPSVKSSQDCTGKEDSAPKSVRSWSPKQYLHSLSLCQLNAPSEVRSAPVRRTNQDSLVLWVHHKTTRSGKAARKAACLALHVLGTRLRLLV